MEILTSEVFRAITPQSKAFSGVYIIVPDNVVL